jgi:hypothetical protein
MDQEHYKRICTQISYYTERMDRAFNRFVQLSIATIGGFIWLKTQPMAKAAEDLFPVVHWIIPFLAFVTVLEILADWRSWFGYREEEARVLGRPNLKPTFPIAGRLEGIRIIVVIIVAFVAFFYLQWPCAQRLKFQTETLPGSPGDT